MREMTYLVADSENRFIWLDGHINMKVARKFKKMLNYLNGIKCAPIVFYIKGPGGDPYSAFQMMSDIEASSSPVATVAHAYVNSACFTITQAGDHRLALRTTRFSFHPSIFIADGKVDLRMTQEELMGVLDSLRLTDAMQLVWFLKRARPVKRVIGLFIENSTIDFDQAHKLKIMDDYYDKKEFLADRERARGLIKKNGG